MLIRMLSAVCLIFWLSGPIDAGAGMTRTDGPAVSGFDPESRVVDTQAINAQISSAAASSPGAENSKTKPVETVPETSIDEKSSGRSGDESDGDTVPKATVDDPAQAVTGSDYRWHPAQGSGSTKQPGADQRVGPDAGEAAVSKTPNGKAGAPEISTAVGPLLEPEYVKALTDIRAGHNDSNPVWSPSGAMIAFERSIGDKREIIVLRRDGAPVQKIYCRLSDSEEEMTFLFPGIVDDTSYNAGISWSPDESRLVFMSNGGSGNYDLYLVPAIGSGQTLRLTEHPQKDSHPHWSPGEDRLVFVSGRTGTADVFIMDLAARRMTRLTNGGKTNLYPQWSPDGQKIALIYGSNENHDIHLIGDVRRPAETLKALTRWAYDDLRPVWSPDGTKIAFYSNFNPQNDPKIWSIIVIAADGSDPVEGPALSERIVAENVIPDVERGPAWMPDSRRIIFVKNDAHAYNPLYLVDIEDKHEIQINTGTKMNHDVVCSADGTLAFRAQTEQWDHIYLAKLKE